MLKILVNFNHYIYTFNNYEWIIEENMILLSLMYLIINLYKKKT